MSVMSCAAIVFIRVMSAGAGPENGYIGSSECAACHVSIYREWLKTPHANALIKPSGLSETARMLDKKGSPFKDTSEIEFAIGYHWTRRYILKNSNVAPFLYSLTDREFVDYYDKNYRRTDFRTDCVGCHVTGFSTKKDRLDEKSSAHSFKEAGVGCEACHGPGERHVRSFTTGEIVNPAKLENDRKQMICMSCHTNGNDISGKYKFPVGYLPGNDLPLYFTNMVPKPGQLSRCIKEYEYTGDNSYEDRRRQFNYWKHSFLAKSGSSCSDCLDFRNASADVIKGRSRFTMETAVEFFTENEYCFTCHKYLAPFDVNATSENKILHAGYKYDISRYRPGAVQPRGRDTSENEVSCRACHSSNSVHSHYFIMDKKWK